MYNKSHYVIDIYCLACCAFNKNTIDKKKLIANIYEFFYVTIYKRNDYNGIAKCLFAPFYLGDGYARIGTFFQEKSAIYNTSQKNI